MFIKNKLYENVVVSNSEFVNKVSFSPFFGMLFDFSGDIWLIILSFNKN